MVKLKELYNKYKNYIVIILIALFGLKSCQSCSRKNQITWYEQQSGATIDSLQSLVHNDRAVFINEIDSLRNELRLSDSKVQQLSKENNMLQSIIENYKSTTSDLAKTNKNLSNRE